MRKLLLVALCVMACGGEGAPAEVPAAQGVDPRLAYHCDVWVQGLDDNPLVLEPPTHPRTGPYCEDDAPAAAARACEGQGARCFASCPYGGPRC